MKIVAVCGGMDLSIKAGMIPVYWQLFKALSEYNVELVVVPTAGPPIQSLWWRCVRAPSIPVFSVIERTYRSCERLVRLRQQSETSFTPLGGGAMSLLRHHYVRRKLRYARSVWMRFLSELVQKESNVDYILFLNMALAEFVGVPNYLKSRFGVRTAVYEADFPMYFRYRNSLDLQSLLGFEGFHDFDLFLVNSEGILPQLRKLGARNVTTLDFAADPEVYTPAPLKQDIDIGFFGYSSQDRENSLRELIAEPSEQLPGVTFVVAGRRRRRTDLGRAIMWGDLPFSLFKSFCCRSKLNLNITKETFARTASTTSRLFELCCLSCCVVSNDIQGLGRYFKIGREIFVARNHEEAVDLYRWLLSSEKDRVDTGARARERVLREHTYRHRAQQLLRDLTRV